ncbi:hypothetical protein B0H17DRAFT_1214486 [Mycena rosella]|uniref:Uncharacterized protein n=1 Tax=Mycena rosella TaxID=1033263 RepID=A0AAD7CMZ3_MYCRO|nr:hypothetical protein B0H17DRAFT_1214486 [Mycena rosella]
MTSYKDTYIKAAELSKVKAGKLYDEVTNVYLKKFEYHTAWDKDLASDQDVASDVDDEEDVNKLSTEEAEARSTYHDIVRGKIGVWLRGVERETEAFKAEVAGALAAEHKAALEKEPASRDHGAQPVTKEVWNGEMEASGRGTRALAAEHKVALEAYRRLYPRGAQHPEEYQVALDNAVYYLQPFVTAVQEQFEMNVALLLCGPVPDHGGTIEMHSTHAGMSKGLVLRIWADFDRAGFKAARRSFQEFS